MTIQRDLTILSQPPIYILLELHIILISLIIYKPSTLIISSQTFSIQLGAGISLFCLPQCAIPFYTLSPSSTTCVFLFFTNKDYYPCLDIQPNQALLSNAAQDYSANLEEIHTQLKQLIADAQTYYCHDLAKQLSHYLFFFFFFFLFFWTYYIEESVGKCHVTVSHSYGHIIGSHNIISH